MKNRYKKLYDIMELLEDGFIEEALEEESKIRRFPLWKCIVAAACACVLVMGSGLFLSKYKDSKSQNIGNVEVNKKQDEVLPGIKYEKNVADKNSLEKIVCNFMSEGAGGGGHGWLIVKSFEDAASKNPTRNNTGGITQLPVFKNEDGLWSDGRDGQDFKESEIYFGNRLYEEKRDYSYDGASGNKWGVCFRSDKQESLTDQLLEYTFYRLNFRFYGEEGWGYDIMKPPSGTGKMYPVISLEEAEKKLRNGEFFSHDAYAVDVAGTAQVLSVELEYITEKYQVYLQPFYKFTITDKSWYKELYKIMESQGCKTPEEYKSVSEVYVPAVRDEYIDIKDSAVLRTN